LKSLLKIHKALRCTKTEKGESDAAWLSGKLSLSRIAFLSLSRVRKENSARVCGTNEKSTRETLISFTSIVHVCKPF
jgi:hypothetical protein